MRPEAYEDREDTKNKKDDGWDGGDVWKSPNPFRVSSRKKKDSRGGRGGAWKSSWMDKNSKFDKFQSSSPKKRKPRNDDEDEDDWVEDHFKNDFQGCRVFVDKIPKHIEWDDLKDHFAVAGEVVYASVSMDGSGESKGHGIVQFETAREARNAIKIMRDHPLDGARLFVREDVQEVRMTKNKYGTSEWICDDYESDHTDDEMSKITKLLLKRDGERAKRNYDASDKLRDTLFQKYGVHLNDREKKWWTHVTHGEEVLLNKDWRQIPSSPEMDATVDSVLISTLLKQRDNARKEKDFGLADGLLEKITNYPDESWLTVRVHDDTKTWRMWSEDTPKREVSKEDATARVIQQCYEIVNKHAPEKLDEVKDLLEKFQGREFNILKKLKLRYQQE